MSGAHDEAPLVSIVLPTFRRTDLLKRAIDTVMAQTLTDWELIVVDDNGSEHPTQRQAAAVVANVGDDPRLVYVVHESNQGGGAARNTGISNARADFVAFLDDDDAWYPSKLERQVECFLQQPDDVALVYGGFRRVTSHGPGRIERPDPSDHDLSTLLRRNAIGTTSLVMCRRSALVAIGGFDTRLRSRQDLDLYVRLAQRYRFAFVDAPLLDKHQHDEHAIGKDQEGTADAHGRFLAKHHEAYARDPLAHHVAMRRYAEEVLRTGRTREARRLFVEAWKLEPRSVRTLMMAALSFKPLLGTYRAVRRLLGP